MQFAIPDWLKNISNVSMAVDNRVSSLLLIIAVIVILSFAINKLLQVSIGSIYRLFVAPGVVVHELSHALGCVITGAKINSINVFKKDGGEVRHTPAKIPILGPIIISLAPFIIGALAIFFLAKLVGIRTINLDAQNVLLQNPLPVFWGMIKSIDYRALSTWIALYLITAIAVTMTPSAQDFRNIILSLAGVVVIMYILIKYFNLNIHPSLYIRPEILAILGSCVIILIAAFFLSIVIAIVTGIFKK